MSAKSRLGKAAPQKSAGSTFVNLVRAIQGLHEELAARASRAVNLSLTLRNWLIGWHIAEYELHGADRAKYGEKLLATLSVELEAIGVSSCGRRQLYQYLRFYQVYPQIVRSVTAQFPALIPVDMRLREKVRSATWYRKHVMVEGDNPPVGILLCAQKDHALAEYVLGGMDNRLFVSKYQLHLPTPEQLQRELERTLEEEQP